MGKWTGVVRTAAGIALDYKVMALGIPLVLTKIKLGDGTKPIDSRDEDIDLEHVCHEIPISSRMAERKICKVTGVVSFAQVKEEFYASEMGLFANDPDMGEILYSVTVDERPDIVTPDGAGQISSIELMMGLFISNTADIKIEIDPNALVTVDMLKRATNTVGRSTAYKAGDIVSSDQLSPGIVLQCIRGGVTSELEINGLKDLQLGTRYQDGEVLWAVVNLVTTAEDLFVKDSSGNWKVKVPIYDPAAPVEFLEEPNGKIHVAPRRFYTFAFMRDKNGNVIMRPDDWRDQIETDEPSQPPSNPDHLEFATTEEVMHIFDDD